MIEKLQIRNHGANEKIDIEFSPYVTTIIGKSFIGKSWILRALRWVALNKPAGDSFINWEAERANVRLVADKKQITRTRSSSINTYKLDKKKFTAFGNDVPPIITKVLNLSDINFQGVNTLGQHEPPFWFCKTAGEVSRQLNAIVNLEVIDSTLSNIVSRIHKANTTIEISQEKLSKAIERKKELLYVKDLDQDLKRVEVSYAISQEIVHKRSLIAEHLKTYTTSRKLRENSLKQRIDAKSALLKGNIYRDLTNSIKTLLKLVENGKQLQKDIKARPPSLNPVRRSRKKMVIIGKQIECLQDLIDTIRKAEDTKCQIGTELFKLTQELEQIAGDKCPLCGSKIKK